MEVKIRISQSMKSIQDSQKIRNEVFFEEQGIPAELDLDGHDDRSYHMLATLDKQIVGVARVTLIENKKAVLSRVAVKKEYRGFGIATKLVRAALIQAEKLKVYQVEITPHENLEKFYQALGFKYIKKAGDVCGHQLIKMEKPVC